MTAGDHEPGSARSAPRGGWVRARAARARRAWPGLAPLCAGLAGRARAASAAVAAAAVTAWRVAVWPLLCAAAASPGWAAATTAVADRVCRRRVQLLAAGVLAAGLLLPLGWFGWLLALAALLPVAVALARVAYPHTVRGRVRTRYGTDGWAGFWDHHRHLSAHAARHAAVATRPSIAAVATPPTEAPTDGGTAVGGVGDGAESGDAGQPSPAARLIERLPVTECGTWLGATAVGPVLPLHCFAAHRDVVGLVAPPQTGKSALLGGQIIDHPGAVLATSTRPDLFVNTGALRTGRAGSGRVELLNPEGVGGLASTFRFSPLIGCTRPQVAGERAGLMVAAVGVEGVEDGNTWDDWGASVLASLFLAAALAGADMAQVARWVFNPTGPRGAGEALKLLEDTHAARCSPAAADSLRQVLHSEARKTRDAIFLTLKRAVEFMADPDIAAICLPEPGEPVFDVASFLGDQGTVYLLGSDRPHASVAPLLAAFTGYVFSEAKRIAAERGGDAGRLDPPLMLAVDEAALINPVPLDRWTADAGGRGIHIIWAVQSPSQLAQRWGHQGADTIWNNTNAKLIYGGLTLDDDLEAISRLCGERHEVAVNPVTGEPRLERVRVLPADRLRTLPPWHALLIHRATPATIVRIHPVWERDDVRGAGRPPQVEPMFDPAGPTPATEAAGPSTPGGAALPGPATDADPDGTKAADVDRGYSVGGDIYGVDHLKGREQP